MGRLPEFLCIGGMRCGSTTLWEMIRRHPCVFLPTTKELHFFDGTSPTLKTIDDYSKCFAEASEGQRCGECTPSYLTRECVASEIARVIPRAKLLVILRDPVSRAWSHYWLRVRQGWESRSFGRAILLENRRSTREHGWRHAYVRDSCYVEHLRRFEALFGREAIHVLFLEELVKNAAATMSAVWRHIGVESMPVGELVPRSNPMTYPKWRSVYFLTRKVARLAESDRRLVRIIGRAGFVASKSSLQRRSVSVPLREEKLIRARLHDADRELRDWLGRELPWRKQAPVTLDAA